MPPFQFVLAILLLAFYLFECCLAFGVTSRHSRQRIQSTAVDATKEVLVVGGGVGGLAVASRIAAAANKKSTRDGSINDWHITLLEKNECVGGRCGSFRRHVDKVGLFRHERGPSLLLLPDVYKEAFQECSNGFDGAAEKFGLTMKQCIPAYQVVFEDGDSIQIGFPRQGKPKEKELSKAETLSREKMDSFEQEGAKKWDEYMRATSAFLDAGLPNFIEERFVLGSFPKFLVEALRDFAKAWPLKPHSEVLDAIFTSDKMKALASFQDLYVGLEPYRNAELVGGGVLQSTAPAVFGLLAAIELHPSNDKSGVFAPVGGFQAVTDAMEQLAVSLGVKIKCDSFVTSVRSDGVMVRDAKDVDGSKSRFVPADLIILNADLPYATKSLLSNEPFSDGPIFDWDDQFSFSSGVISFHWSVSKRLEDLATHNVFMMAGSRSQSELSWKILRTNQGDVQPDSAFNFYVHRASATDPTAAPDGCDSIMVLVPCRTLLRDEACAKLPRDEAMRRYQEQFSESAVAQAREAVFKRLGSIESLKGLQEWILDEVVDTPATWADQFHLAAGTPFGLSHGFSQLSLTRPGHESRQRSNVMFCGASTRPGNGVPLVLIGAKQVAEKATRRLMAMQSATSKVKEYMKSVDV